MSPVFKFHLLVPAAERRGVKPEKIGQCRVWAECGVEGSGPVGRGRERERESAELRHSLGQQTDTQSRRTLPTINTATTRDLNGLCRALLISRDYLDHGTMTL